jgi:hypothetical protein
LKKKLLRSLKT